MCATAYMCGYGYTTCHSVHVWIWVYTCATVPSFHQVQKVELGYTGLQAAGLSSKHFYLLTHLLALHSHSYSCKYKSQLLYELNAFELTRIATTDRLLKKKIPHLLLLKISYTRYPKNTCPSVSSFFPHLQCFHPFHFIPVLSLLWVWVHLCMHAYRPGGQRESGSPGLELTDSWDPPFALGWKD